MLSNKENGKGVGKYDKKLSMTSTGKKASGPSSHSGTTRATGTSRNVGTSRNKGTSRNCK